MAFIEPLKPMRIGCDNVVWCKLLLDDGSTAPVYQTNQPVGATQPSPTIVKLPGVMQLNVNPNTSIETAFYDDGPGEVASTLGNVEITFNKSALGPAERAMLLGISENKQGIIFNNKVDVAPWGALGFRTLRSDGSYRYVWLMKGKFTVPQDSNETKADSINFQSDEITGRFVKLNWPYSVENSITGLSNMIRPWKVEIDGDSIGGEILNQVWFSSVILPDSSVLPEFSSTGPKGYIFWENLDNSVAYMVEMSINTNRTLSATGEIDSTGASILSYYIFEYGIWTDKTADKSTATIDTTTQTIVYNSMQISNNASVVIATLNPMPGVTLVP